jgi:enoyl-CoA hydratase/carnithine racemase
MIAKRCAKARPSQRDALVRPSASAPASATIPKKSEAFAMADEVIKIERHPNYITLALNRPEKRNAINIAMLEALDAAFTMTEGDPGIRAVIIRGEGRGFCSGLDLRDVERASGARVGGGPAFAPDKILHRLQTLPVPAIAAVHGDVLTAGLVIALLCDLRIAAQSAKLGMTPARIGYLPTYAVFRRFTEIAGAANTAEIMYLAEPVDAARAREMGLVHKVVPDDQLNAAAAQWAEKIAGNAPLSVRAMKRMIGRTISRAFEAEHEDLNELAVKVRSSADAKEGVRAFLEKRKAVWRGE